MRVSNKESVGMLEWFESVWRVARAEFCATVKRPAAMIGGFLIAFFWLAMLALTFGGGIMQKLPVGVVDLDGSADSRQVLQILDALPSVRPVAFETNSAADEALKSARVYGVVTIPPNFEKDRRAGIGAPLRVDLNKTYYAVGTILELDMKTALAAAQMQSAAVSMTKLGGTFKENAERLRVSLPEVYFLGNPAFSFSAYLLPTIFTGVLALAAILAFTTALVRDWRSRTVHEVMALARGSGTAVMIGKLLPWFALFAAAACAWVAMFAGFMGWQPALSAVVGPCAAVMLWCLATILLMFAMAGMAALAAALGADWVFALAAGIALIAPTFPYTGFSYPLEAMSSAASFFGSLLPLTVFLHAQAEIWVLGSPVDQIAGTLLKLALPGLVLIAGAAPVYARRMQRKADIELQKLAALPAVQEECGSGCVGFWRSAGWALRGAVFNRDTFIITAAAVAFYLLFYAWPYSNQQIENVPVGVTDLDQSNSSRRLIRALDASSTAEVVFIEHDPARSMESFRREKTDVLLTIPKGFAEDLARGENTTLHLLGTAAFPVKARAVQAALAGAATDISATMDEAAARTAGIPTSAIASALIARPGILVNYRFNTISGYGSYTVPMVGPVIIQAVLLMGITMAMGGWLSKRRRPPFMQSALERPLVGGLGIFSGFWFLAMLWFGYMEGFDFMIFEFGQMANPAGTLLAGALFCAAVTAFAMAVVCAFGSNAWTTPAVVVMSAPALFISGAVWPLEGITNPFVQGLSQLIPSTPGILAIAAVSQDGASTSSILPQCAQLLAQTAFYLFCAWAFSRRLIDKRPDLEPY